MSDPLSDRLFPVTHGQLQPSAAKRCLARQLGLNEAWFRDTIFANPELVIAPCRAAGLTDDEWYAWAREYRVAVGSIDVLLISAQGKVAIVETKLSGNPELRRRVLAQALDYLSHLPDALDAGSPPIPKDEAGNPVAEAEDVHASLQDGDVLVLIVSDRIDDRVARLSKTLMGDHLIKQWDLVLLDLALFQHDRVPDDQFWIVPCIRGMVVAENRQVVRVVVEGETPRVRVEVIQVEDGDDATPPRRQKWDERRFFDRIQDATIPEEVRALAEQLRGLASEFPQSLELSWGTGKKGSMTLKRNGTGLAELYSTGEMRFRPWRFAGGLGDDVARDYHQSLERLFPGLDRHKYMSPPTVVTAAPSLITLIRDVVERAEASERRLGGPEWEHTR